MKKYFFFPLLYLSATPLVRIILSDDQITIFLLVKYCCTFFKEKNNKKEWQKGSNVPFLYLVTLKLLSAYFIFILIFFTEHLLGWLLGEGLSRGNFLVFVGELCLSNTLKF